jgi:predicted RNA-binding Zn ribbon-like protein
MLYRRLDGCILWPFQASNMSDPVSATPYVFDLDGGNLCLDFANTRGFSSEHLHTYADLLSFASQAKLLTPDQAARLQTEAERVSGAAQSTFEGGARLRNAVRKIFKAAANQERPEQVDLDILNADLAVSLPHARVVLGETVDDFTWAWDDAVDLSAPLWPIARSAAELLVSDEERGLVRECGAGDCAWLFLDTSKNRSRQWCSMQSCGNREKARRHYQRVRERRTVEARPVPADDAPPAQRRPRRTRVVPAGGASATAE